jgi:hypothetical protein
MLEQVRHVPTIHFLSVAVSLHRRVHHAPRQDLVQAISAAKDRFVSGGAKSYFEPAGRIVEVLFSFFSISNAPTRPHSVCTVCRQFAW